MSLDYYSEIFKKLLLRNVAIKCGTKTCRAGKIQNFDIKQFYVKLFIENNKNNIKVLELPYPYTIQYTENVTTLNYHTTAFCNKTLDTYLKIKLFNNKSASKYFNNNIEIHTIE
jgi:hypothetical protein